MTVNNLPGEIGCVIDLFRELPVLVGIEHFHLAEFGHHILQEIFPKPSDATSMTGLDEEEGQRGHSITLSREAKQDRMLTSG